jgi:hypothetical protein
MPSANMSAEAQTCTQQFEGSSHHSLLQVLPHSDHVRAEVTPSDLCAGKCPPDVHCAQPRGTAEVDGIIDLPRVGLIMHQQHT